MLANFDITAACSFSTIELVSPSIGWEATGFEPAKPGRPGHSAALPHLPSIGDQGKNRTSDTMGFDHLLYLLSYPVITCVWMSGIPHFDLRHAPQRNAFCHFDT